MKRLNKKSAVLIAKSVIILLLLTGCMNMGVVVKYDSDNPVPQRVTKWSFFWGFVQPRDARTSELCESICQVRAKNNIGYIFISAVTLGLAVPIAVEYECCPHEPEPGDL